MLLSFLCFPVSGQEHFSLQEYKKFLKSTENLTSEELSALHSFNKRYYSGIEEAFNVERYAYLDTIIEEYELTDDEMQLLQDNHFFVTERHSYHSFGSAFADIFHKDLPVFLSTDAILHALHKSYVEILMDLEINYLEPNLVKIAGKLYNTYDALKAKYDVYSNIHIHQALQDVDHYVTIAKSLIHDELNSGHAINDSVVSATWNAIERESFATMPLFTSHSRKLDFSQFTPRGHYKDSESGFFGKPKSLEPYFRCMMWLGRIDFMLSELPEEEMIDSVDIRRMTYAAFMLNELIDMAGVRPLLDSNNRIIDFFVGESDNLTTNEFSAILDEMNISSAVELTNDIIYAELKDELTSVPEYGQEILSSIFYMDPFNPEPDALPVSFRLMGQRFIIDSYVFSNVVYDRIVHNGSKIWRPMPNPLDALFVIGNNDALPLLQNELDAYHYASQLASLRYLVDSYDDSFWNGTLYNSWIHAIRTLNPDQDTTGYPYFMMTDAWRMEKINTQLASWTQLRHDNLLYAKQSYTGGIICSYPHSYIEPYPDFYEQIGTFAEKAKTIITDIHIENSYMKDRIMDYYTSLAEKAVKLSTLATKELNQEPFNDEETAFLKTMLIKNQGPVCGAPPYSGWFFELFYNGYDSGMETDYLVADVHTQPTDEAGNMVGKVLHTAVGKVNLGVFLAKSPSRDFKPVTFVGPVMSYYEKTTRNFHRMTDQEWTDLVNQGQLPVRPQWTHSYLAHKNGKVKPTTQTLPNQGKMKLVPSSVNNLYANRLNATVFPIPANNNLHIGFTLKKADHVQITCYNALGKQVIKNVNQYFPAGQHQINWNIKEYPVGMYLINIQSGKQSTTKKIVIQ